MPVESDVYIFGYQSILAKESLGSTIGQSKRDGHFVPAWLHGHQRTWNAVRDFQTHASKRYVLAPDWSVASHVAFCNLQSVHGTKVNGICQYMRADQLRGLDFREQGYQRVDVTAQVQAYAGHALRPNTPCHAYIDTSPARSPAPTSSRYFEMGRRGAKELETVAPGFFQDYCHSTGEPSRLLDELVFVYISSDGQHLWLLDEHDSTLTLLLHFEQPQFPSQMDGAGAPPAELTQAPTNHLKWLDLRTRADEVPAHPWISEALAAGLIRGLRENPKAMLSSPFWVHRLAASQSPKLGHLELATLHRDPDPWVRRSARSRTGEIN